MHMRKNVSPRVEKLHPYQALACKAASSPVYITWAAMAGEIHFSVTPGFPLNPEKWTELPRDICRQLLSIWELEICFFRIFPHHFWCLKVGKYYRKFQKFHVGPTFPQIDKIIFIISLPLFILLSIQAKHEPHGPKLEVRENKEY